MYRNLRFAYCCGIRPSSLGLYEDANLQPVYQSLLSAQTQLQSITAFLKTFDDLGAAYYTRFADDASLVKSWFRYYDEPVLKGDFLILSNLKQIDFVEIFGNIKEQWFSRFRQQPYLFDRFNTATENSILLAKQNYKLWIRINRYYQSPTSLGEKLSSTYLKRRYQSNYAEILVNAVEEKAQEIYKQYPSRTFRDRNFQLISGVIDKEQGIMSDLYTNFSAKYFENMGDYDLFRSSLHPNIRVLIDEIEDLKFLYNVAETINLEKTGHYIASHAEIRALDNLIKKRFGNNLINETVFDNWIENSVLGYNRNIQVKEGVKRVIMPRCADCFYITDLLTFIQ